MTGSDATVILCLQDFHEELASQQCRDEVHKVTKRASEDIRFDDSLADACYDDRARFCEGIQPVGHPANISHPGASMCLPEAFLMGMSSCQTLMILAL